MISSPIPLRGFQYLSSFITVFIIFLNFPTSISANDDYNACSSSASCGKVQNIGYPFWGEDLRPRECGIQTKVFKLKCPRLNYTDDYPLLQITDEYDDQSHPSTYEVLVINNSTNTIQLQAQYPWQTNCSIPLHDPAFSGRPFEYTSSVKMIYLFECSDNSKYIHNGSIACLNHQTRAISRYYYVQNSSDDVQKQYSTCRHIPVPVLRKELEDLEEGNGTLEGVLKKGFEVGYLNTYLGACVLCEGSGGTCGSSDDHPFVCFCKNPHQHSLGACSKTEKLRHALEIAIPVGLFVLMAFIVGLCSCKMCNFRSQTLLSRVLSYHRLTSDLEIGNAFFGIPLFSYAELQEATKNFDPNRVLGDGAFGVVYHGKLRDGREVAVKRLYEKNYKKVGHFMNEVEILTKLSHPNLVTLHGCTSRHSRELLLVYDYVPNGTVADHLYGNRSKSRLLTWTIRMKIAIQTAGALSYLHASDIIHRDVKTSNILLESNFTVKVADFGLSRLFPFDATHLSTIPQGTPGYLDPEYTKNYQVTNKSDVYSFGVILIELISSLPAIDINRNENEVNLSTYAVNKIQLGKLAELIDQNLGFESDLKVKKMITLVAELAFQCLQQEKEVRPSMEEVLEALKRIESVDHEAQEMKPGVEISKPASGAADNEVEMTLSDDAQNPSSSSKLCNCGLG